MAEKRQEPTSAASVGAPSLDPSTDEDHPSVPAASADPTQPAGLGPRYRWVSELASGGMGRVFIVEDTVLRRQVAVKEMRRAGRTATLRFEREALLTARLEHPGIVSIHELGRKPSGEPYLIMRRVRGEPFDQAIARAETREKRLGLLGAFLGIADAMAYAHGQGIVHRDLKPGNLLLGEFGEAVVIDWGLAKSLPSGVPGEADEDTTEDHELLFDAGGEVTREGSVVGTPMYMSPEQARGAPLDTRADVYALGVILYQLLSGQRPYEASGTEQIFLALQIGPPLPLAVRAKDLAPELVTIVERAMARDPAARYPSAKELAADLRAFQTGQLVRSHSYSLRTLLSRFARRHALTLTVGGAALLLLAGVSVAGVRRIVAERDRANVESVTSRRTSDFLVAMFKGASPLIARGKELTARDLLDRGEHDLEAQLGQEPAVKARLMDTIGSVYTSIGLYAKAQELLEREVTEQRKAPGPQLYATLHDLAICRYLQGSNGDAAKLLLEAAEGQARLLGAEHADTLGSKARLAGVYFNQARFAEAEQLARQTLEASLRVLGPDHPDTVQATVALAGALVYLGRQSEGEQVARSAVAAVRRTEGADSPTVLPPTHLLTDSLREQGKLAEAEALELAAVALARRVLGAGHVETLKAIDKLAALEQLLGKNVEAEKLLLESAATLRALHGPEHVETLQALHSLALVYRAEGRLAEAEALQRDLVVRFRKALGPDHPASLISLTALADVLMAERRLPEAEAAQREALEAQRRVLGEDHPSTALSRYNLGAIALLRGDKTAALALLREAMDHGLSRADLLGLGQDEDLKTLRTDPRFAALVADARARAEAAK